MIFKKHKYSIIFTLLDLFFVLLWCLCFVAFTDVIKNAYYFIAVISLISMWNIFSSPGEIKKRETIIPSVIMGILFSIISVSANYFIFIPLDGWHLLSLLISAVLSFVVFVPICLAAFSVFDRIEIKCKFKKPISEKTIFFICFFTILLVYSIYLYGVVYPGILTHDSIDQIEQSISGQYVNHHPFWHTIFISAILHLGMMIFNDINVAVSLFSLCQIIFMSAGFAFVLTTIYQATKSKVILFFSFCLYIFTPYNIIYGSTMWKDIPFAIAAMILIVFLYRILFHIGNSIINGIGLSTSIFLFGSWRTNGLIALCISVVIWVPLLIKKKKLILSILSVTLLTIFMNTTFLGIIGVGSAKFSESLSIPLQQVSRVIHDGYQINSEDKDLLGKILDYDTIAEKYNPILSDPIKNSINHEADEYLKSHKSEYFRLWLRIGLEHPQEYVKAWIDQTKGYWNAGYDYPRWESVIIDNDFGIKQSPYSIQLLQVLFHKYCKIWKLTPLNIFMCIGLLTLAYILSFIYFVSRKKTMFIFIVPILSVIITLLIATPVFCEFRYAYILFTCFPVLLLLLVSCNKFKIMVNNHENRIKKMD